VDGDPSREPRLGAYGLRLRGVNADELLVPGDPAWPELSLSATVGESVQRSEEVTGEHAFLRLRNGGHIALDRAGGSAAYVVPHALGAEELVHPYLAPAASVMAHWLGRESFHAGGVVLNGGVWGVVGDRQAGKSTLLARLALAGHDVVADDLLVLDVPSATVYAGPRSVDLREDAAEQLGAGEELGLVGARERWRLRLAPVTGPLELRGWIFLRWGERAEIRAQTASERLTSLASRRGIRVSPSDPAGILELAALPCFELRRPRRWDSLERAGELLLATVSA
jgi:hypothetical protein